MAFSCKGRYVCASRHQKLVLQFGEWLSATVPVPVPHFRYVFTLPKIIRVYFRNDRCVLEKPSQYAYTSLKVAFQAAMGKRNTVPGEVIVIQPESGVTWYSMIAQDACQPRVQPCSGSCSES